MRVLALRPRPLLRWLAALLLLLAVLCWLGSRQPALQWLAQAGVNASGGRLSIEGVSGSLYGTMRFERIGYRSPQRNWLAEKIEMSWAPWQVFTAGMVVSDLQAALLCVTTLTPEAEPPALPQTLALPLGLRLQISEARLGKAIITTPQSRHEFGDLRFRLDADARRWHLQDARVTTAWGTLAAAGTLAASRPFAITGQASLSQPPVAAVAAAAAQSTLPPVIQASVSGDLNQLILDAGASMQGATGQASLTLAPFAPDILRSAKLQASAIDPARFRPDLPSADLSLELTAQAAAGRLDGRLALHNHAAPGSLERQILPLRQIGLGFSGQTGALNLTGVTLDLGAAGKFSGAGGLKQGRLALTLHTAQLNLQALHARLRPTRIAGHLVLGGDALSQTLQAVLAEDRMRLELDALLSAGRLQLRQASLRSASGELQFSGEMKLQGSRDFKADGRLAHFNPAQFGAFPAADLNARIQIDGALAPHWQIATRYTLQPSRFLNQALSGQGSFSADARHLRAVEIDFRLGGNLLAAHGNFGAPGDRLEWRVDAARLQAFGTQFGGEMKGGGSLAGTLIAPLAEFRLQARALQWFDHRVRTLQASGRLEEGKNGRLQAEIELGGIAAAGLALESLRLSASGTRGAHTLKATAQGSAIEASGSVTGSLENGPDGTGWRGRLTTLENRGRLPFTLQNEALLRFSGQRLQLTGLRLGLPEGSVHVQSLEKDGPEWRTEGQATGIPLLYVMPLFPEFSRSLQDKLDTDLRLGASWSLQVGPAINGSLRILREGGDAVMRSALPLALGIDTLKLEADIVQNALRARLDLNGARTGQMHFEGTTWLAQRAGKWGLPGDSPLTLNGSASLPSISWLALLSGMPGLELDGLLALKFSATGSVAAPRFRGDLHGEKWQVRWPLQGVKLKNGIFNAQFNGDQLILKQLRFDGEQGTAQAEGALRYAAAGVTLQATLSADRLQLLARPDRLLVVSGNSKLTLNEKHLLLEGKFKADRASILLAPQDAPVLSNDIVVLGAPPKPAAAAPAGVHLNLDLEADLGEQFFLQGMGLDAQLAGSVRLRSGDSGKLRATGGIHVVKGSYAAYGQKLQIERGLINFIGPLDNPGLNILALRKRADPNALDGGVEAGVEVRGTAQMPSAKLVSTPVVPDSEKLSWLVLGHGIEGVAGQELDLLGAAAGALFGTAQSSTRLAGALSLDELGLSRAKGLESTVLTVGKRLSSRAYLTVEQGAGSATSLIKLRYALNSRLSLQAQTGTSHALDLFYTWVFD